MADNVVISMKGMIDILIEKHMLERKEQDETIAKLVNCLEGCRFIIQQSCMETEIKNELLSIIEWGLKGASNDITSEKTA